MIVYEHCESPVFDKTISVLTVVEGTLPWLGFQVQSARKADGGYAGTSELSVTFKRDARLFVSLAAQLILAAEKLQAEAAKIDICAIEEAANAANEA